MPNRRKPFVVKQAEGNRGKRKLLPPAYVPGGDFDPPFGLSEVARAEWDRIRAEASWIRATDAALLAMRCDAWAEYLELRAEIAVEGRVIGGAKNPKVQFAREAKALFLQCDRELGLTSMSRERITAQPSESVDPEDAVMFG